MLVLVSPLPWSTSPLRYYFCSFFNNFFFPPWVRPQIIMCPYQEWRFTRKSPLWLSPSVNSITGKKIQWHLGPLTSIEKVIFSRIWWNFARIPWNILQEFHKILQYPWKNTNINLLMRKYQTKTNWGTKRAVTELEKSTLSGFLKSTSDNPPNN